MTFERIMIRLSYDRNRVGCALKIEIARKMVQSCCYFCSLNTHHDYCIQQHLLQCLDGDVHGLAVTFHTTDDALHRDDR